MVTQSNERIPVKAKRQKLVLLSMLWAVLSYGYHAPRFTHKHDPESIQWPGFWVRADHAGAYRVAYASHGWRCHLVPPAGAELIACDGIPINDYMKIFMQRPNILKTQSNAENIFIFQYGQDCHRPHMAEFLAENNRHSMVPLMWRQRKKRAIIQAMTGVEHL